MTSKSRSADDELPDIIDIVRDVVDALSPALPAHLEQLADRARTYVEMASSANTRRAYGTPRPSRFRTVSPKPATRYSLRSKRVARAERSLPRRSVSRE